MCNTVVGMSLFIYLLMPLKKIRSYFELAKEAWNEFIADNVIKLSASLAYYTIFSIGPLLLVIFSLTGLFVAPEQMSARVYGQIQSLIGAEGAQQVFALIQNLQ